MKNDFKQLAIISDAIRNDEDYLRDDDATIDDFITGKRRLLPISLPRRGGKTSFLFKIERRIRKDKVGTPIYLNFEMGFVNWFFY